MEEWIDKLNQKHLNSLSRQICSLFFFIVYTMANDLNLLLVFYSCFWNINYLLLFLSYFLAESKDRHLKGSSRISNGGALNQYIYILPYETLVGLTLVMCWDRWRMWAGLRGVARGRGLYVIVLYLYIANDNIVLEIYIFVYIDFWKPQLYLRECYCSLCEKNI